jgi:hypothetical protein
MGLIALRCARVLAERSRWRSCSGVSPASRGRLSACPSLTAVTRFPWCVSGRTVTPRSVMIDPAVGVAASAPAEGRQVRITILQIGAIGTVSG